MKGRMRAEVRGVSSRAGGSASHQPSFSRLAGNWLSGLR